MNNMSHNNQTSTFKKIEKSITLSSTIKKTDTSIIQTFKETTITKTETSISPISKRKLKTGTLKESFKLKLVDLLEIVKFLFLLGLEFLIRKNTS
jgi:hypothetical protein